MHSDADVTVMGNGGGSGVSGASDAALYGGFFPPSSPVAEVDAAPDPAICAAALAAGETYCQLVPGEFTGKPDAVYCHPKPDAGACPSTEDAMPWTRLLFGHQSETDVAIFPSDRSMTNSCCYKATVIFGGP
jgi:hypothetical protein